MKHPIRQATGAPIDRFLKVLIVGTLGAIFTSACGRTDLTPLAESGRRAGAPKIQEPRMGRPEDDSGDADRPGTAGEADDSATDVGDDNDLPADAVDPNGSEPVPPPVITLPTSGRPTTGNGPAEVALLGIQYLPCNAAGTLATIEAYAKKPSLEGVLRIAGCAIPNRTGKKGATPASVLPASAFARNRDSASLKRQAKIEAQTILDLALRLAKLATNAGKVGATTRDQFVARMKKDFSSFGALRQGELPFDKRDATLARFDAIARAGGANVTKLPSTLDSSQFPAWKFAWSNDPEILETQAFDQLLYKIVSQWAYVRAHGLLKQDARTPNTFVQLQITARTEVTREKARIEGGAPSLPAVAKRLDSWVRPIVPFLLVAEPVYLIVPTGDLSMSGKIGNSTYSAIVMDLLLANRFQEIQGELRAAGVKTLITMGSYNHRFIRAGVQDPKVASFSRHSFGTAIDVSGVVFSDGKSGMVRANYTVTGKKKYRMAAKADPVVYKRLETVRGILRKHFRENLGPGDANHDDHFHVDLDPQLDRPKSYPLTSRFDPLVARYGWVNLKQWQYTGKTPWAESLDRANDRILPTFLSDGAREIEKDSFESASSVETSMIGSSDAVGADDASIGFARDPDAEAQTCDD